jgi:hypothetical protein
MTDTTDESWRLPTPSLESMRAVTRSSMEAYEKTIHLAQSWTEGIMVTYTEQAESYGAMLKAVDKSLDAMEEVVENQSKITEALGESLDASRQAVAAAMHSNTHSTERVETFVGEVLQLLNGQLDVLRGQIEIGQSMLSTPASAQSAMFLKMSQDWAEAYERLLGSMGPSQPASRDD